MLLIFFLIGALWLMIPTAYEDWRHHDYYWALGNTLYCFFVIFLLCTFNVWYNAIVEGITEDFFEKLGD